MNSPRIIFILIMLCCAFSMSHGQGFSPSFLQLLDSSLHSLDMKRIDLSMPHDFVKPDKHRSPLQISLFENPLLMGSIGQLHIQGINKALRDSTDQWFMQLMKDGYLGEYTPRYLHNEITAREIDKMIGHQLESITSFANAIIIRQYLGPILTVIKNTASARSRLLKDTLLLHHADSLLMLSEESANLSLYALKQSEIEGVDLAKRFFSRAESPKEIIEYGLSLIASYPHLFSLAERLSDEYQRELKPLRLNTPYGKIAIGTYGDDVYEGNYLLILDPGGNDMYAITGGKKDALLHPVQCIVDLSGNDTYRGGDYALGSGYFGIGILHDLSGDDVYSAGNFSLGAGVFGIGYVHDRSGMDSYSSKTNTQGMGFFGIGILQDIQGNDHYAIHAHGQAFAGTRGIGILTDHAGNDSYICASPFQDFLRYDDHFESFAQGAALGYRPIASGGLALLIEHSGNDVYVADIYGQGTGYWYGFGGLIDLQGSDMYKAHQYAQGSGVHLAQGLLWDASGNDSYTSYGVSQGCGHDIAVGLLIDEQGNDSYTVESLSLGAGNANAISLFTDLMGDDSYIARNPSNTMGYSDFRRNYGMIGIFADAGGNDIYGNQSRNNSMQKRSTFGLFMDAEFGFMDKKAIKLTSERADSTISEMDFGYVWSSIDSIFIRASAAPQKYQSGVETARKELIALGLPALSYCEEKYGTQMPRERLALEQIIPQLYKTFPMEVEASLLRACEDDSSEVIGLGLSLMAKLKLKSAIPVMLSLLDHGNWRIRSIAAKQIGEIGELSDSVLEVLSHRLHDEESMVRASTAYSIGKVLPLNVVELLQSAFFEEAQIIRNSAIMGMRGSNRINLQLLKSIVGGKIPEKVKDVLTPLLIYADTSIQAKEIAQLISNTPIHRAHIVIDGLLNEANGACSERAKEILRKVLVIQIDTTIKEKIRKNGQIQLIQENKSRKK
jgi:hypothetical protein